MKPRVYWCYYPKLKRGFWRVSQMRTPVKVGDYQLWHAAHREVAKANNELVRNENADQASREMCRQSH